MQNHDSDNIPSPLSKLNERFTAWRRARKRGERIPASLWRAATQCAANYGLNRTAKALRLDYYSLKKHMNAEATSTPGTLPFVALPTLPTAALSECLIELENGTGASIRVHLKGAQVPDLLALSRELWGAE
jgi:hypothetical protein